MRKIFLTLILSVWINSYAQASTERFVAMDDVIIEDIHIEGIVQKWKLRKICLDGQVYLMVMNDNNPISISPAFRDGKPEQCKLRLPK